MLTFAQKPKAIHQTKLARSTISGRAHRRQSREVDSILQLQHTIGNHGVQRMMQTNAEELKEGLANTASYGFSQIPVHPKLPPHVQAEVRVAPPGDIYEEEANRVSEQVMRMPELQLQRACSCGGGCRKCQTKQPRHGHERFQTQRVGSGDCGQAEVPPIIQEVLRSPGQSIDPATRAFMELRLGHDFSQVRVHHDGKAAESAKTINALAYTSGNHIAFNDEQYGPTTEGGKRLLAHELVHTMQQGNNLLHRKIDFTEPKPILFDPIPLALNGLLGSTVPGFNGELLPAKVTAKKHHKEAVFNVLQPQTFKFSDTQNGKTCKVDADKFNISVFAEVRAITKPQKDKWSGSYLLGSINNPPSVCAKKKNRIQIEMKGKPDSTALYKKVLTHEQEHVTDLETLSTKTLKPYHDFLIGLTGTGKTDEACAADIFRQVGKKDALAAAEFVDKWLDAVQVYDKKGGTHHSKFETKVDADCTKMQMMEKL